MVCVGGPLDGRRFFVDELPVVPEYEPSSGLRVHPYDDVFGAVWRHVASARSTARCQPGTVR